MCRGTSNLAEEHQFVVAICLSVWKANTLKSQTQTPVYFCMNFVFKISQKLNEQSSSNFHIIFALMRNGDNDKIKLICGHLGYANQGQRSNLISFSISATVCPIEPNFCMHMECDQTIILHNKITLICGHLSHANQGQRSNLISFSISATVCPMEPNFCMHMECDHNHIA